MKYSTMQVVQSRLIMPEYNRRGKLTGTHERPTWLLTPTGKTDDGQGYGHCFEEYQAAELSDAYNYHQALREALESIAKHARSDKDDPSDEAFREYALRVAQDALRDIIGEEVTAQERGAK